MIRLFFTKAFLQVFKKIKFQQLDCDSLMVYNNITRKHMVDAISSYFDKDENTGEFRPVNLHVLRKRYSPFGPFEFEDYGIRLKVADIDNECVKLEFENFIGDFINKYSESPFVEPIDIAIISGEKSRDRFIENHLVCRNTYFLTTRPIKEQYKEFECLDVSAKILFDPFNKYR